MTQFYDDLDHTLIPEDQLEVVRFSVNGQNYLIDLSTDNARHFHNLLAPYVDAARIAPALDAQRASPSHIREWAHTQGLPMAHRGKIPQDVIEAYNAAN
ncbi:Lsr2 family protein [Corynebacterium sp. c3Ub_189]|uniref:histone-like nucleoid-structuring protein Lsr2 n=1 Tax=Corynebacterium sp. c3Ub_189 TaxID=3032331 RepID=UPI003267740E